MPTQTISKLLLTAAVLAAVPTQPITAAHLIFWVAVIVFIWALPPLATAEYRWHSIKYYSEAYLPYFVVASFGRLGRIGIGYRQKVIFCFLFTRYLTIDIGDASHDPTI
jgi:hypothetical protein